MVTFPTVSGYPLDYEIPRFALFTSDADPNSPEHAAGPGSMRWPPGSRAEPQPTERAAEARHPVRPSGARLPIPVPRPCPSLLRGNEPHQDRGHVHGIANNAVGPGSRVPTAWMPAPVRAALEVAGGCPRSPGWPPPGGP